MYVRIVSVYLILSPHRQCWQVLEFTEFRETRAQASVTPEAHGGGPTVEDGHSGLTTSCVPGGGSRWDFQLGRPQPLMRNHLFPRSRPTPSKPDAGGGPWPPGAVELGWAPAGPAAEIPPSESSAGTLL